MKKLTELDLQTAMDECAEIKFKSHGEWLAGMVKRLNKAITIVPLGKSAEIVGDEFKWKKEPTISTIKTIIKIGDIDPEVPCIS